MVAPWGKRKTLYSIRRGTHTKEKKMDCIIKNLNYKNKISNMTANTNHIYGINKCKWPKPYLNKEQGT